MPTLHPIPDHIKAQSQPMRKGYVLQVLVNGEVSKSAWTEVHQTEGWGIRLITDENGRIKTDPDNPEEVLTERVEAKFEARWVKGQKK